GRCEEAEPLYERLQTISEKVLGPEYADVATSLNNRAEFLRVQGKHDEADPLYARVLKILAVNSRRRKPKLRCSAQQQGGVVHEPDDKSNDV
ncbi:unnamed protein product, partial [Ectocarpus sp. 13 AM-2016]